MISEKDLDDFLDSTPRYTSYPTYPVWNDVNGLPEFSQELSEKSKNKEAALYVHLPFCEKLCHFCACNRLIDPEHRLETKYLKYLKKEMVMSAKSLGESRITQIHWGGGTPTFLRSDQLIDLFNFMRDHFPIGENAEVSIELHPNVARIDQLEALEALGFTRLSMGVQDFDPVVQETINRNQSFEQTEKVVLQARALGFKHINLDLIYGLPKQTLEGLKRSVEQVIELRPQRIAFYSYANVPWREAFQRKFLDSDIPEGYQKLQLYLQTKEQLENAGYHSIGLDHFSIESDELYQSYQNKNLSRNFMGYTTRKYPVIVGFGISAISSLGHLYAQNEKKLKAYYDRLDSERLPIRKAYWLKNDDELRRELILDLMCFRDVEFDKYRENFGIEFPSHFRRELDALKAFEQKAFVKVEKQRIKVTKKGRLFVRSISSIFDSYFKPSNFQKRFSKTI